MNLHGTLMAAAVLAVAASAQAGVYTYFTATATNRNTGATSQFSDALLLRR
jgi:hypothetical protein